MQNKGCRYCQGVDSITASLHEAGEQGCCILHSPDKNKDVDQFTAEIRAQVEEGDFNFSGYTFPSGTADFTAYNFDGDVDFSMATFLGEASFRSARFGGAAADFTGATFLGAAIFKEACFNAGDVFFSRAQFCGSAADFSDARFSGQTANFIETTFEAVANFRGAEFQGTGTYFTEAVLAGGADFSSCLFRAGSAAFKWARFGGDAVFTRSTFSGEEANFQEARFSRGTAAFDEARFSAKNTIFSGCRFSGGGCSFSRSRCSGKKISFADADLAGDAAEFRGAIFTCARVIFHSTLFSADYVNFSRADFGCDLIDFRESVISSRRITFADARFLGKSDFADAHFFTENPLLFNRAEFAKLASFTGVKLQRGAQFDGARFFGDADFSRAVFACGSSGRSVSFRGSHFGGSVSLNYVDLRHALFAGFRLSSELRIDETRWPAKRYFFRLRKRFTCGDEMQANKPDAHRSAAAALKELEQKVRKSGAQRIAHDFVFSSYECARKARPLYSPRRYLDLVFGAWLSGYGQKMGNVVLSALSVILLFAILFLVSAGSRNLASDIPLSPQAADCLAKSFLAFFSAGLIDAPSATPLGRLLLQIEGVVGLSIVSAFIGLSVRRARASS